MSDSFGRLSVAELVLALIFFSSEFFSMLWAVGMIEV